MTIEIHNPELEVILQQRLKAGNFANVEDMLLQTLRSAPEASPTSARTASPAKNLFELFAPIRGLLTDEEIDTLFSRNPAAGRAVDLA